MTKEDILFQKGIDEFNKRCFYDAHEYWEELWLDYKLKDATFIQGLIQLAVSYFHLFNNNLNGARSMIHKCLGKFQDIETARGLDINELKKQIEHLQTHLNSINDKSHIIDSYIIVLKVVHE